MFPTAYFAQQILNGIVLGSMYALLALGMTVIYGILRLINFAHGAVVTIGAFCFYVVFASLHVPFVAAIGLIIGFGAIIGILLDIVAYKKIRGGPEVSLLITSLGFYIFIENLLKLLASPQPYAFRPPAFLSQLHADVFGLTFLTIDIFIILVSVVIMIFFFLFVKKSKLGIAMRATADSVETSRLVGIDINRVIALAFVLASAIAAITGFMWGGKYGQISYDMGFLAGVKAFVAVVIGGIGSIPGAMLGGYVLGVTETLSIALLPPGYAEFRDGIVFVILILVLLFKPSGVMGRRGTV